MPDPQGIGISIDVTTGLDDRFRLTLDERAIGLPEDYFRQAWEVLRTSAGISREQMEWLHRLEHRQARIAAKVGKIKTAAEEGVQAAAVLESFIETYPIILRPRQGCPDCFSLFTHECLLKTPEEVVEHFDIDFLIMLLEDQGESYDDNTPISKVFEDANELLKFPHKAWFALGLDGRPIGGMCPVCGWEGQP